MQVSNTILLLVILSLMIYISILHGSIANQPPQREGGGHHAPTVVTQNTQIIDAIVSLRQEFERTSKDLDESQAKMKKDIHSVRSAVESLPRAVQTHVKPPPPPPPRRPSSFKEDWTDFIEPQEDDEALVHRCSFHDGASTAGFSSSSASSCRWEFVKYIPSTLENMWWEKVDAFGANPCPHTSEEPYKKYFDIYRQACRDGLMTPDKAPPRTDSCQCDKSKAPRTFDETVFSRFMYKNNCTKETKCTFIEPLAGVLRHPEYCHSGKHLSKKDWMIVDQWSIHRDDAVAPEK